jgi:hypothetical protein
MIRYDMVCEVVYILVKCEQCDKKCVLNNLTSCHSAFFMHLLYIFYTFYTWCTFYYTKNDIHCITSMLQYMLESLSTIFLLIYVFLPYYHAGNDT